MNLLYVHETLGSLGGAEANVLITATELNKQGVTVGLFSSGSSGKNESAWNTVFESHSYRLGQHSISEIQQSFQPDLIYVHKWDDLATLEAWRQTGNPIVRMVHDHDVYCLRSYKYHPLTRKVCHRAAGLMCIFPCLGVVKRDREGLLPIQLLSYRDKLTEIEINRKFDAHFVVTEYMRNELEINQFPKNRIHIFPPVPREVKPLTSSFSDRNLIVFAGQIIRGKGVDILLKALSAMKEPFEAIILGDGNHRSYCEVLCRKLNLQDRVHFAGFVPQEELRNYYAEATAVVVPSVWPEPIATIGLEVMRYGLPVVAFDAGGISDWLKDGENGYLVPWMDTDCFASHLDSLMQDKDQARRMGEAGRHRVERDYGFNEYINRLRLSLEALSKRETLPK